MPYLEAAVLTGAASACLVLERPAEARSYATRARALARDAGYAIREADALLALAEIDRALGDPDAAREHAQAALARYSDAGCRPGAQRAGALVS
jgi:tetratricopeptide (TPR) repeat protein